MLLLIKVIDYCNSVQNVRNTLNVSHHGQKYLLPIAVGNFCEFNTALAIYFVFETLSNKTQIQAVL